MAIGRPSKLTPELVETVCNEIRLGMPYVWAAVRSGITEPTFHRYKNKGNSDLEAGVESTEADFCKCLKSAEADFMHNCLLTVQAAPERWQAQMTLLERRFPADFGRRLDLKHGSDEGEWSLSFGKRDGGSS